ncbi:MAG: hypothetical protein HF975_14855 [ANME-2 cluster archaeon]|nr:hypothetical protein [ANME-2 cluster archaeon]MBC2708791.1 hypothetical protein [ANME-2 cluster archaeon]MBC2748249.1 hypothetical protein [ANME-2 cluster archaeon]
METNVESNRVWLYKDEYDDMLEYIDRLTEIINVLSDRSIITAVKQALSRINSGEYLTKENMVFD